jgi:5-methylcytosine-specific restriction endonuclease McrA
MQRSAKSTSTADEYDQLRLEVLRRDGWRCQACGSRKDLQVHHQLFRSHGGDDAMANLITLCADCHARVHNAQRGRNILIVATVCGMILRNWP